MNVPKTMDSQNSTIKKFQNKIEENESEDLTFFKKNYVRLSIDERQEIFDKDKHLYKNLFEKKFFVNQEEKDKILKIHY